MKEIKTKPAGGKPRTFDKGRAVPKTAMKKMWIHAKEKTVRETMNTPFAGQQETTSNAPANTAGEQMLSSAEIAVNETAYYGGQQAIRFAGRKIKERRKAADVKREILSTSARSAGDEHSSKPARRLDGRKSIEGKASAPKIKANASESIKQGKSVKVAQQTAAAAQKTTKAAQQITQRMQAAAKTAVQGIRAAAHAVMAAFKASIAAAQSLAAAILAGGWVAVVVVLLICLIALVMGSSYGIFFGVESTGSGTSVSQAVRDLNQEYAEYLQQIKEEVVHDRQEMTSNDSSLSINWQEVLAVFSAKMAGAEDGAPVVIRVGRN